MLMSKLLFWQPLPPTGALLKSFSYLADLTALAVGADLNVLYMDEANDVAANKLMVETLRAILRVNESEKPTKQSIVLM